MRIKHHNPLHIVAVAGLVMLLVSAYQDPDLSRYLVHWPGTGYADFDQNAQYVIGQTDFTSSGSGSTARQINGPFGQAYDAGNERLFVSDFTNNRVLVFDVSVANLASEAAGLGSATDAVNVLGQVNFTDNTANAGSGSGNPTQDGMEHPSGLAFDESSSYLYVTDVANNRVLVFDLSGGITNGMNASNVLGQATFGTGDACVVVNDSCFTTPSGLAYDSGAYTLYVSDSQNNRVLAFDIGGGITDGMSAGFVLGQPDTSSNTAGTDWNSTSSFLTYPSGVVHDADRSRLYVADTDNNRVVEFSTTGITTGTLPEHVLGQANSTGSAPATSRSGMSTPSDLGYNGGYLYVGDNDNYRILEFDVTVVMDGEDAGQVFGQADFTSQELGSTANRFVGAPGGLAYVGASDLLFVSDFDGNRVLVFQVTPYQTPGDVATDLIGQVSFTASVSATTDTGLASPSDVVLDAANHRLFIADQDNNRVLMFELDTANTPTDHTADAVLGQATFTNATPGSSSAAFDAPSAVAYDAMQDLLFVSDTNNNRIMVFNAATITDGEAAINVLGQPNFATTASGSGLAGLYGPRGLSVDDASGLLIAADTGNNRALVYDINAITDGEAATKTFVGATDWATVFQATGEGYIWGMGIDTTNDVLYVGTYVTNIYRCPLSSGCNEAGDFSLSLDLAAAGQIQSIVFDSANGVLYAGTYPSVYRCDTTTGCNETSDWTAVTNHAPLAGYGELTLYQGILYEGYLNMQWCDIAATNCDQTTDWNSGLYGYYMAADTVNDVLYTTGGTPDGIWRCDIAATGCDDFADQTQFLSGQSIGPIVYDSTTQSLYAAAPGTTTAIYRCDTSTGCDGDGDWTLITTNAVNSYYVQSWGIDTTNNVIYGGTFLGDILSCEASTGCDETADWMQAFETPSSYVNDFAFDAVNGVMYSGGAGGQALLYSCAVAGRCTIQGEVLSAPRGVLADTSNDTIWIADTNHHRVLGYDLSGDSDIPPYAVLGQSNMDSSSANRGTTTADNGFNKPVRLSMIEVAGSTQRLFVSDKLNNRVLVFNTGNGITNGESAADVYGQGEMTNYGAATNDHQFRTAYGVEYDETSNRLYVADTQNNRVMIFGSAPASGGGGQVGNPIYYPPGYTGFFPIRITVNDDDSSTDTRNVFVQVYADFTDSFNGTVDLMLSNVPDFSTFLPFRYVINNAASDRLAWPKTISWDLCFGLPSGQLCDPGQKTVYARFYPNIPRPTPARSPIMPSRSVSPTPTPTPTPAQTTIVPQPVCPTSCRQLGLYDPGEVTGDGCTHSGSVYGYNNCLRSNRSVGCRTVHRAAGPACYVPSQHTNYCFRCP